MQVDPEQGGMQCLLGRPRLCLPTPRFWEFELMLRSFCEELLEFGEKRFSHAELQITVQCVRV